MYTKDKTNRITLRLNDEQFAYIVDSAGQLDVSPSDYLRMVINVAMVSQKKLDEGKKGVSGRENDSTNKHDIV